MRQRLRNVILILFSFSCVAGAPLAAQSIAEKKAGFSGGASELTPEMQKFLVEINKELRQRKEDLQLYQNRVLEHYLKKAPPETYQAILQQINEAKENIRILQESWREMAATPGKQDAGYALWHQPETTLEQLVIDYGSLDYVYLIPPEIAKKEVSVSSSIPIPHASWSEMLEEILLQNGVGIKELNPYLRELYLVHDDLSSLRLITADPLDLEIYPSDARVSFVLTPEPMDVKRIWYFLEKFVNPNSTVLERIGRAILIVGEVSAVKDLLKIYDFVSSNKRELEYKAVPLYRVQADEMAKILAAVFEELVEEVQVEVKPGSKEKKPLLPPPAKRTPASGGSNSLNVIALPSPAQAVFLIGTGEEIKRAEAIIQDVEGQVGEARQRSIFWYNVKHSDPEELAKVMEKLYKMMVENRTAVAPAKDGSIKKMEEEAQRQIERTQRLDEKLTEQEARLRDQYLPPPQYFTPPYYQQGDYVVNPRPIQTGGIQKVDYNKGRDNFIVDPKTGSLVMVVETDLIPKLRDVLKKLDVPKKMVQIEVLLFERTMTRENSYGLNLLKVGSVASNRRISAAEFSDGSDAGVGRVFDIIPDVARGVTEFFFSRQRHSNGFPAFDLAYKFIMNQDNVFLNASPSVVTMNQTEALIAIKDEQSIKVGTLFPESNSGVAAQDVTTRAQYGIQIKVTPTIHFSDEEDFYSDPTNYVSLVSEITFDTFPPGQENSDQPRVNRRQIINEVRIPDGQSVIIGGLRKKQTTDAYERIPFLGEIPGLGKLFSSTTLKDDDTEMIIFITPKIISEPVEDFHRLRTEHLCKRPGDLPAFIYRLNEALEREKERLFQGYMSIILGRPKPRYLCEEGEYDGR